jgi:hypothetical protein
MKASAPGSWSAVASAILLAAAQAVAAGEPRALDEAGASDAASASSRVSNEGAPGIESARARLGGAEAASGRAGAQGSSAQELRAGAESAEIAIVADAPVPLRASPRAAAPVQAQLWRGDLLEVRGSVPGYLRVYDHRRERPGFVRPTQVRRARLEPGSLPALTALALFFRDQSGSEELGIAYASLARALLPAARPGDPPGDPLDDALAVMADRLARRASQQRAAPDASLAQALDVVAAHGIKLLALERDGHIIYCSDGAAELRALSRGDANERVRAALLLTHPRCGDSSLPLAQQAAWSEWRAQIAGRAEPADALPELGMKLRLRRAEIDSQLAFTRSLNPEDGARAAEAARAAEHEFLLADRAQLAEEDQPLFDESEIRVAASRWAGPAPADDAFEAGGYRVQLSSRGVELFSSSQRCAEQCAPLLTVQSGARPWVHSLEVAPDGSALSLLAQPLAAWTELWIFHRVKQNGTQRWVRTVLVPAAVDPGIGSIECAGFTPHGKSVLLLREAMIAGKLQRRFQELSLSSLRVLAQSDRAGSLRAFNRYASPAWRERTTALR